MIDHFKAELKLTINMDVKFVWPSLQQRVTLIPIDILSVPCTKVTVLEPICATI